MPESVVDRCTRSHETIFLLTKQKRYFFDHEAIKEPSRDGSVRNMRSVWHVNPRAFKGAHFATFPTELIEPMVRTCSRPGDTVIDPFAGAGTTALVAAKNGRNAVSIELNPEYVALAKARLAEWDPM